ncbi:MAG: TPM domain-containing protein [Oscillospiraceae bacterium]|nr:TPM domain-containing protein [Oscillospiraceae bacterium]
MRIRILILFLLVCSLLSLSVFATEQKMYIRDDAEVLTDGELADLQETFESISLSCSVDILAVTVDTLGYASVEDYAETAYGQISDNPDGVILLLSFSPMGNEYFFLGQGRCADTLESYGYASLESACSSALEQGRYATALEAYAHTCEELFLSKSRPALELTPKQAVICILIGAALSFLIPMNILRAQLRSVHSDPGAANYICKDGLKLSVRSDRFLYRRVTHIKRETESSGSKGGRGGKF